MKSLNGKSGKIVRTFFFLLLESQEKLSGKTWKVSKKLESQAKLLGLVSFFLLLLTEDNFHPDG